jgi:hypothetical protein
VLTVLHHRNGTTVSSDFAREHAPKFAAMASTGLITTATPEGFGRKWRLTSRGLAILENHHA